MQQQTTTNIRLPKEDLQRLKYVAVKEHKSVSALIRDLVRERIIGQMPADATKKKIEIWDLPKHAVRTGHRYLARDVDRIVYGRKNLR